VHALPLGLGERDVLVVLALGRLIDQLLNCALVSCIRQSTDLFVDFVASLLFRAMLKGKRNNLCSLPPLIGSPLPFTRLHPFPTRRDISDAIFGS
jgi:hypothetical protein